MQLEAKLIPFEPIGKDSEGYLCVASIQSGLPFTPVRSFWTFNTPTGVSRGRHAHYSTVMVLLALSGTIRVTTESVNGDEQEFTLDSPQQGLLIPKLCWHEMWYSPNAVQLVFASTEYNEQDYIRNYRTFQQIQQNRRSTQ